MDGLDGDPGEMGGGLRVPGFGGQWRSAAGDDPFDVFQDGDLTTGRALAGADVLEDGAGCGPVIPSLLWKERMIAVDGVGHEVMSDSLRKLSQAGPRSDPAEGVTMVDKVGS